MCKATLIIIINNNSINKNKKIKKKYSNLYRIATNICKQIMN